MSREEATELIFGHQNSFDPNTIDANYQSIYSRIQGQITHAPDAELKQKFQSKLGQLEQAYAILTKQNPLPQELPSLQPIEIQEKPKEEDNFETISKETGPSPQSLKKPSFGEAIMNKWVFFTTLSSIVLGLGMTILWSSRESNEEFDKLTAKIERLENVLENKNFNVFNKLDYPILIERYYAVYYDNNEGKMKRYGPVRFEGDKRITIEPGAKSRDVFKVERSTEELFPGKALFVSISFRNANNTKMKVYRADYVGDHIEDGLVISPIHAK